MNINISRRALTRCLLSIAMTVYLFVAVSMARSADAAAPLAGVEIIVSDSLDSHFVSAADVNAACGNLTAAIDTTPRSDINTLQIEQHLESLDRVEHASCVVLANGVLRINVTPMIPVARVFPDMGNSYYVSAAGKRIDCSALHHIDVPVVSGHIRRPADVMPLLPMFAHIKANPELDAWVSSVSLRPNGDIVIIPSVVGHTVTLGDTSDIDNKFERVKQFYARVMPVKGWKYYEDISVKWRGRVVATRRDKKPVNTLPLTELDGAIDDTLDDDVMLSGVNPSNT